MPELKEGVAKVATVTCPLANPPEGPHWKNMTLHRNYMGGPVSLRYFQTLGLTEGISKPGASLSCTYGEADSGSLPNTITFDP